MSNWTVCFDSILTVNVEAKTEEDAISKAEDIAADIDGRDLLPDNPACFSVGCVYLTRNDDTDEEVLR